MLEGYILKMYNGLLSFRAEGKFDEFVLWSLMFFCR